MFGKGKLTFIFGEIFQPSEDPKTFFCKSLKVLWDLPVLGQISVDFEIILHPVPLLPAIFIK